MRRSSEMNTADAHLQALGVDLDDVPTPQASYLPARRVGDLVYTSGMGTRRGGVRHHLGVVGGDLSVQDARAAARIAGTNCLLAARHVLGSLDEVSAVVQLIGYVRSAPGFTQQHQVLEGASELMLEVFGERGQHTRAAVGVAELPLELPVEVQALFQVRPRP
jgi:enamine deaminase RidA (YjgF/YER057c/UK114 family)